MQAGYSYRSKNSYTTPYDSTQGIPDGVIIAVWIVILILVYGWDGNSGIKYLRRSAK